MPLGGSLIPWIDADRGDGTSLEEWKGGAETNKILGRGAGFGAEPVPIDSTLRAHRRDALPQPGADDSSLKKDVPLADIEAMIAADNEWVQVVPNTRGDSIRDLTPVAVTGTMTIPVGRLRKLAMGPALPGRVHGRRPAAVGRRRAAATHAANPSGELNRPLVRRFMSLSLRNNGVQKTRNRALCECQPLHELVTVSR